MSPMNNEKVIYNQRNELMVTDDISGTIEEIRVDVVEGVIDEVHPPQSMEEQWDLPGLEQQLEREFNIKLPLRSWLDQDENLQEETIRERILEEVIQVYREKEQLAGPEVMRQLEKSVMLQSLDTHWREHLTAMDHLRRGIHSRGYAQKNPKQEYKREAFLMFTTLLNNIRRDVIATLSVMQVRMATDPETVEAAEEQRRREITPGNMQFVHAEAASLSK